MYVEGLGLWSIFIASSSYESILSKISLGYSSTRRSEGTRLLLEYAQPPYSSTGNQGAGAARWDQYAPHARDPPDKHNFFMTDLSIIAKLRTRLEFARSNPDPLWESLLQTANAKHELVCVCGGGGYTSALRISMRRTETICCFPGPNLCHRIDVTGDAKMKKSSRSTEQPLGA